MRLQQPWFRSALPVDGAIVGLETAATGSVSVTRDGTSIRIAFHDLQITGAADADLRVQMSGGDIVSGPDGVSSFPAGRAGGLLGSDPIEVGVLPNGQPDAVVVFGSPGILPDVHTVLVVDYTSNTVLAGAELIPADG